MLRVSNGGRRKSRTDNFPVLYLSWSCTKADTSDPSKPIILDGMDLTILPNNFKVPLERAAINWMTKLGQKRIAAMSFKEKSQLQLSLLAKLLQGRLIERQGIMGMARQEFWFS